MQTWSDERCYWLGLYLIPGLGNRTFKRLIDTFGDPRGVFNADPKNLLRVVGIRQEAVRSIARREPAVDPVRELEAAERCGVRILTYGDRDYPHELREIHAPPMVLYVRGRVPPQNGTPVAVVGSRNATHYGLNVAERLGRGLGRGGVAVVSGMARGIDTAAHWGCLGAGGYTVAVLGTGVDQVYPRSNGRLMARILETGTVLSEFPMGTLPEPRNFPIRNRLISGLSRGVVVVEATRKSGSLITAAQALEQGREVFAVPGSVDSIKSAGTHFLLKQGARLVEGTEDILEELAIRPRVEPGVGKPAASPEAPDGVEGVVFRALDVYPLHIDEVVRKTCLPAGDVLGALMTLELKGLVRALPGRSYVRSA